MAKTPAERHAKYHQKVRTGELKRLHVYVPAEIGEQARLLADAYRCTQRDLFVRLIAEEWQRWQGSTSLAGDSPASHIGTETIHKPATRRFDMRDVRMNRINKSIYEIEVHGKAIGSVSRTVENTWKAGLLDDSAFFDGKTRTKAVAALVAELNK